MGIPTAHELFLSRAPLDATAREERERAFFRAITIRNGTHKTTYARRLDSVNAMVNDLLPRERLLEIMDVGVSSGITTLEWVDALAQAGINFRMTAGDVCIFAWLVSFGSRLRVLVDQSGHPLQFDLFGRGIPYPLGLRRSFLCPPVLLLTHVCRRLLPVLMPWLRERATPIALVSPELAKRGVRIVEDDLLAPGAFAAQFDVVRAANVLNRSYFDEDALALMCVNLRARLRREGLLIVCSTDERGVNHGTAFRANAAGELEVAARIGEGSAVEQLVLEARAVAPALLPLPADTHKATRASSSGRIVNGNSNHGTGTARGRSGRAND